MLLRTLFLHAIVLIGLSACASVDRIATLQPGATEADATAAAGRKPEYIWNNPDGTRTLDYSNQPFDGFTSWFVTVDAAGKILKTRPLQVDAEKVDIKVGMSTDQVRRQLGSPRTVGTYMSGEEIWDWNTITSAGPDYLVRFNVHFKEGKVVRTSTKRLDRNDCRMVAC